MADIVQQFTSGTNGGRATVFVVELDAVNKFVARQKARAWVRREIGPQLSILSIRNEEEIGDVQTTFSDLFPEQWGREKYRVAVEVDM